MLLETLHASLRAAFCGRLLTGADAAPFLTDYRGKWTGQALAVVHSNLSLTILLAAMIFAKLWFLAFAIVVMWLVYVAIRKSQSEKEKGVDL